MRTHPAATLAGVLTFLLSVAILASVATAPAAGPPAWVDRHHGDETAITVALGAAGVAAFAAELVLLCSARRTPPAAAVIGVAGLAALALRLALVF